jgi:hypothetical protein
VGENSNLYTVSHSYNTHWGSLQERLEELKEEAQDWDWDAFIQRAIVAMTPTLESGFEVTQFLYEFKEIFNLVKWWKFGKSVFRNLSNDSLNYSFGVLPFISDCKNLYEGLRTLDERLSSLKKGVGQLKVRHYSEVKSVSSGTSTDLVGLPYDKIYHKSKRTYPGGCRYGATMHYTYQLPDLDRERAKLKALLDTIGAHLDLYSLWNVIPFSFVVDWFLDVGGFLKQFRKQWITPSLYIKEFGVSTKLVCEEENTCIRAYDGLSPSDEVLQDSTEYKYYNRKPYRISNEHFDATWSTAPTTGLTLRKAYLGGLLLEQRTLRL